MTFAEKLLSLRKQHHFSQEDLAEQLGVSRQAISRWEQGIVLPDAPNLLKLSDLFSVSVDYLLRDEKLQSVSSSPVKNEESEGTPPKKHFRITQGMVTVIWFIGAACFFFAAAIGGNAYFSLPFMLYFIVACHHLLRIKSDAQSLLIICGIVAAMLLATHILL